MDETIDLSTLSLDDVKEEYVLLKKAYVQLRASSENDAQKIYELKRSLATALAAQEYMAQELEQCSSNIDNAQINKLQTELDEWKRKHVNLQEAHTTLQQYADQTAQENERLTASIKEMKSVQLAKKSVEETEIETQAALQRAERLRQLEEENLELLQKLNIMHEENVRLQMAINDKEIAVETLRDSLQCLEENLRCKRSELEEKTEMLESAQEQLCEANAKIAMLTSAPVNEERKGNSLFAEVDDQRQQMRQLLAAQKRVYLDMKKTYNESQYEIRRLKNENIAMHKEMEACTTLFVSTNKSYQEKLLHRLKHATREKERVEKQLKLMHERLIDLGNQKGVNWLDSILSYCKKETEDLKQELRSARREQASVEEQLRNTSQKMAFWRFEALTTRCVLLDRENLLNNNNIEFKPKNVIKLKISEEQLQKEEPIILSTRRTLSTGKEEAKEAVNQVVAINQEKLKEQSMLNNEKEEENKVVEIAEKLEAVKIESETEESKENCAFNNNLGKKYRASIGSKPEGDILAKEEKSVNVLQDSEVQKTEKNLVEEQEDKENYAFNNNLGKKYRASISSKPRGLLAKAEKSVRFSPDSPSVHNYEKQEQSTPKTTEPKVQKIQGKNGVMIVRHIMLKKPKQK